MQAGVLNRQQPGRLAALVHVGVPVAWRGDEGATALPVDAAGVADAAVAVELGAHQGVHPGLAVDDQIQGNRLMPVRGLGGSGGHDPEHRPEHMGHGAGAGQVAAITRARIKWSQNFRFWSSVPPVTVSLKAAPGLVAAIGIGEAPIGLQGTFSLWESAAAIREFAYKGAAHQKAIADTSAYNWYSEELFARFAVREVRGSL